MIQRYGYILFIFMMLGLGTAAAQEPVSQIRVGTSVPNVRFEVDGVLYQSTQTFFWARGSKHILSLIPDQPSRVAGTRYNFTGWALSDGTSFGSLPVVTVTADPSITSVIASVTVEHTIYLYFYDCPNPQVKCPGSNGQVTVNGQAYYGGTQLWLGAGANVSISAEPAQGFVFGGWSQAFGPDLDRRPILTFVHDRPRSIFARFDGAKPIRLETVPPALTVLVDRTPVRTPVDLDWAFGTPKLLSAAAQRDEFGSMWVLEGFDGLPKGQNVVYTPAVGASNLSVVTARFIPGASLTVSTNPVGLKVKVQGSDNPVGYNITAGVGRTIDVEAPLEQTDASGRKYVFDGWSNNGTAAQTITLPLRGLNLIARYRKLNRVIVDTRPSGYPVTVDGRTCPSPCVVDRESAATAQIAASPIVGLTNEFSRLEFTGWQDGPVGATRGVTFDADAKSVVAVYQSAHRIFVGANPERAARITFSPASPDGFYRFGTNVTMNVEAVPGFRFRRWEGDLTGTFANTVLPVTAPRQATAFFDSVPFADPAGVRNAAAETPEPGVAPGSVAAIIGTNLTDRTEQSPSGPLAQTLGGVIVRLGTRLLPIFWVSPERIDFQVPSDLEPGTYRVAVVRTGQPEVVSDLLVVRNAPGIFTRDDGPAGQTPVAVAFRANGNPVTVDAPAVAGEQVTLLTTGGSPYDLLAPDGFPLPDFLTYRFLDSAQVLLGDLTIDPSFAGGRGGQVGVNAIRFVVPGAAAGQALNLKLRVNGRESNTVVLPVR
ncbi:MAG: hypothetical protein K2X03_07205 [Bryobacteraceae bacterium]|nr:hypothetical protein [Bryobacteraceae bacterium]